MAHRKRDPTQERWWIEYEHAAFGIVRVACTWARLSRGIYAVVPLGVEFDLFTPEDERERMVADLKAVKMRILLDEHDNRSAEHEPW